MTLAELLSELGASQERIWFILQYWSSVSFGLIVGMHIIRNKLHWVVVSILLSVYSAYSFFCLIWISQANRLANGAADQAAARFIELQNQGEDVGILYEAFTASSGIGSSGIVGSIAMIGLFASTVSYTVYRQWTIRSEAS